jgi:nitrite reductase (NO-forming)
VEEKKLEIAPGVKIWALTFNGSVPAPMIVVHQNDYVQLTLVNPSTNTMQHNIDFHAATGAMGGGDLSLVNPGEQTTIRFKAIKSGVFIYHCAPGGLMVPLHVTSGMNGAGTEPLNVKAQILTPGAISNFFSSTVNVTSTTTGSPDTACS